jgi:hypothetical protein
MVFYSCLNNVPPWNTGKQVRKAGLADISSLNKDNTKFHAAGKVNLPKKQQSNVHHLFIQGNIWGSVTRSVSTAAAV